MNAGGKRFPGSFGSAFMYQAVPHAILFREEHSKRVLVPKVEFISATGHPAALLTGKALFSWQKDRRLFRLESVHPGSTVDEVRSLTGFEFESAPGVAITAPPSSEEMNLLKTKVTPLLAADYPDFAKRVWGIN
ncbi:MAG: CoA synthetase, partial [Betaproteobacteria bacterium]|nr:CoA synthetase [Betaproteobacteria bacterium]